MKRLLTLILLVLSAAVPYGCRTGYRTSQGYWMKESAWPYARRTPEAQGSDDSSRFNGTINLLWETRTSDKPAGPITLYHDQLYYAGTRKRLRVFDLATGANKYQAKLGGIPQTGVILYDSTALFALAPPRNRVYALGLHRGKFVWSQPLRDAAAGSIIVNNRLIVSSGDGSVWAFDPLDGHKLWRDSVGGKCLAPASYGGGKLFQPTDQAQVVALAEADGKELYRVAMKGPIAGAVAIDDRGYATDIRGNVTAFDTANGQIVWQTSLTGPIWGSPTVAGERIVVGSSSGEVVALDKATGKQLWAYSTVEVVKASPLVAGPYVVVGTMGGKLFILKLEDGSAVAQEQLVGAISISPVADQSRVIVVTDEGRIRCYGERNDGSTESHNRSTAQNLP